MKESTKKKLNKALNIVEWVIVGFTMLLLIFILIFANRPKGNASGSLFGFETRLVLSDSMKASDEFYKDKDYKIKSIAAGDAVFLKDVDYQDESKRDAFYADLKVGDVVTYQSLNFHVIVTHRITKVSEVTILGSKDVEYTIQGDNVSSSEYSQEKVKKSECLIIGKVIGKSAFVGWIYNVFFNNKFAVYAVVITPIVIGAGLEVIKITKIVKENKLEKMAEQNKAITSEVENKDKEIEELKRQLEDLKKKNDKSGK